MALIVYTVCRLSGVWIRGIFTMLVSSSVDISILPSSIFRNRLPLNVFKNGISSLNWKQNGVSLPSSRLFISTDRSAIVVASPFMK